MSRSRATTTKLTGDERALIDRSLQALVAAQDPLAVRGLEALVHYMAMGQRKLVVDELIARALRVLVHRERATCIQIAQEMYVIDVERVGDCTRPVMFSGDWEALLQYLESKGQTPHRVAFVLRLGEEVEALLAKLQPDTFLRP